METARDRRRLELGAGVKEVLPETKTLGGREMTDKDEQLGEIETNKDIEARAVSRREFLKIAGVAGAAVGVGAGLGGVLAACGAKETTTTTAAPATTTTTAAPATTTTAPASTTTVSAGPETGREIKVGVVAPVTGMYAVFAIAERWGQGLIDKYLGPTAVLGDGKSHKVSWLLRDTQSDSNRAAQVTSDLILNDKVDILSVGGGPDTAMPTADQAETLGTPLIGANCPWQAWIFGRGKAVDTVEKWVFCHALGIEDTINNCVAALTKIPTNKIVGLYFGNTADTQAWLTPGIGVEDALKGAGYTSVYPGPFNIGTEDYSALIAAYKKAGCEINFGSNPGKDFPNFWTQCLQQGYRPKACVEITGLAAPEDQFALGDKAVGILMGASWDDAWPYKDPISGMTNVQLGDDYEATVGSPRNSFIGAYARPGWIVDVLKRTKNLDDKQSIVDAIKTTKLELITGMCDLTSPVDLAGKHVTANVYKQLWGCAQMEKGTKFPIEVALVSEIDEPSVKINRDAMPITYAS
jgi:branched-chain amino acid transport system substrate-binding protein